MIEIFKELAKFNHITFHDDVHKYIMDGKDAISVTKLISKFEKPFDSDYWATRKAKEEGVTKEVILSRWKLKADIACEKGSAIHSYIENRLYNKIFPYPEHRIKALFNGSDPVINLFKKLTGLVDYFIKGIEGKLIPIRSEFVIGDREIGLCGMLDQLFYNVKSGNIEIWDWKSNEKITTESNYKLLSPLEHISDSKLDIYSLQTSLYRYIIEKNTNLVLGDSYLAWFNESNEKYVIYKCVDYRVEAKMIIDAYFKKK